MMATDYDTLLMLYIERIAGTISPEDDAMLETQLARDFQAKQIWAQIEKDSHGIDLQSFTGSLKPDQSLSAVKAKLMAKENRAIDTPTRFSRLSVGMSIAASILLLLGLSWFYYTQNKKITDNQAIASIVGAGKQAVSLQLSTGKTVYFNNKSPQKITIGKTILNANTQNLQFTAAEDTSSNLLIIPKGENYQITLSDGTLVILNAASSLKFPFHFGNGTRDVYLSGEAYFKVAKDKTHPFIVHTPLTQVQVVGTTFNINSYEPNKVATSLIEGKVLTKNTGGKAVALSPGNVAVYTTAAGFNIKPFDTEDVISWVKGIYYFHDLSLGALADRMSRIYSVEVKIANPAVASKSVSGIMDRDKLPELLEDLKTTVGIKYYYAGDKLHIE